MQVTFSFDPACPWTWLTSRWLLRVAETEDVEVVWSPFSLAHLNRDKEPPAAYKGNVEAGRSALRVVERLHQDGDQAGIGRFYEAWGTRVHRAEAEPSVELVREAAEAAGLGDAAAAIDDGSYDAAIAKRTDASQEAAGCDVGSPVLRWTDDDGRDVHIFGPIVDELPDADASLRVWQGVRLLAPLGSFKELKRGRPDGPKLAGS